MELAAEQVLSKEQARLLARCYELILSWPTPEKVDAAAVPSADQLATGQDSANDSVAVATVHGQPIACSEEPVTAS